MNEITTQTNKPADKFLGDYQYFEIILTNTQPIRVGKVDAEKIVAGLLVGRDKLPQFILINQILIATRDIRAVRPYKSGAEHLTNFTNANHG
jgi:hypothetical protein